MTRSRIFRGGLSTGAVILLSLILLLVLEYSHRRDLWLAISWPFDKGGIARLNPGNAFLYSWSLIIALFLFLLGLFRRLSAAVFVGSALVLAFAYANYRKGIVLQDFLRHRDIGSVIDDAPFLLPFVMAADVAAMATIVAAFAAAAIRLFLSDRRAGWSFWTSAALLLAGAGWISVPTYFYTWPQPLGTYAPSWPRVASVSQPRLIEQVAVKSLAYAGIEAVPWNEPGSLRSNGLLLQFLMGIRQHTAAPPAGYSAGSVCTVLPVVGEPTQSPVKPNIIVMIAEAFWDPRGLPRVRFSPNPLAAFDRVAAASAQGHLLSPVFGALSVNAEFEVLSGMSISRLPFGMVPFQAIDRDIPALPRTLRRLGYSTLAIVPFVRNFRNTDVAYRHLGFERHIGSEDFVNPETSRGWISDAAVLDKLKAEIAHLRRPYFAHVFTLASHAPYSGGFKQWEIDVDGDLSDQSKLIVRTYAQAIQNVSRVVEKLIEFVDASGEPTMLAFFGDHLPALGANLGPYREARLIPNNWHLDGQYRFVLADDIDLQLRMHSTPLLIYQNFRTKTELPPVMSALHVGGYLLRTAGLADPFFTGFLGQLIGQAPGIHRRFVVGPEGRAIATLDRGLSTALARYDLLVYDRLFGRQFSEHCPDQYQNISGGEERLASPK